MGEAAKRLEDGERRVMHGPRLSSDDLASPKPEPAPSPTPDEAPITGLSFPFPMAPGTGEHPDSPGGRGSED